MPIEDWSDRSPDAEPCFLVWIPPDLEFPHGAVVAVHRKEDVAAEHARKVGGATQQLPYFRGRPQLR